MNIEEAKAVLAQDKADKELARQERDEALLQLEQEGWGKVKTVSAGQVNLDSFQLYLNGSYPA